MTLGSHQTSVGRSQTHITSRWVIDRLGLFELDPCAADPRPWDCARRSFTNGMTVLSKPWAGRIRMNPPFHRYQVGAWIRKLADHGHGTALLHARTETSWFMPCWKSASGILFLADRIHFHRPDGTRQPANSGAGLCSSPSVMKILRGCARAASPARWSRSGRLPLKRRHHVELAPDCQAFPPRRRRVGPEGFLIVDLKPRAAASAQHTLGN